MPGGSQTCEDCGETYNGGTDLSRYGCRCKKAMYTAAKANRAALNDEQPQAPTDSEPIGGRIQCEHCWGFYNKGTNYRLYGCPCQKAKLEAVFAEPQADSKSEGVDFCHDLQCYNTSPCPIHDGREGCGKDGYDGYTVYYWPGFSGRAQAMIGMLVEAQATWRRIPEPCKQRQCYAVPMVSKGSFCLSQTIALAQYLGEELGYNHPPGLRHVGTKLAADIIDVWSESYDKRCNSKSWQEVDEYCKDGLADWFCTLNIAAEKYGSDGFFLGSKTSYVDFLWWNVIEVILFAYGAARLAKLFSYAPRLEAIYKNIASKPRIVAYSKEEAVLYPGAKDDAAIPVKE